MSGVTTVLKGSFDGQEVNNCISWVMDGDTVPQGDLVELAGRVLNKWQEELLGFQSESFTLLSCTATDMLSGYSAEASNVLNGGNTGVGLPALCAGKVSIRTATPGVRGRTGIAALPVGWLDPGNTNYLLTTSQSALNGGWLAFVSGVESDTTLAPISLGVISRFNNGVPRTTPLAIPAISSSVSARLGSRRSRNN